jgi:hypothetical protein
MGYTELIKHMRYKNMYKPNELYWGLGIEEESYLQFTKPIYVAAPIIRTAHAAERYSVKYYNTYDSTYKEAFTKLFTDASGFYPLPYFLNAHCFTRMDTKGNHMTTYEKVPKPNPKFSGKTFFQNLEEFNRGCGKKGFSKIFEESCIFDGDTIEFMTQDFYNAKVDCVIGELVKAKADLLAAMNHYLIKSKTHRDKGLLMYPPVNPGFAVFYSNPKNITMFNNGTYHINMTLPTMLGNPDENGIPRILDLKEFREGHKKFIRLIQWLEPLIIGVFGTKDPLSAVDPKYSKASQRCAVSRYIGVGTYDTDAMTTGKIVTIPVSQIPGTRTDYWWYKVYHANSGYKPLDELGMDISYRKHYNHGVEIRFLDWFPETMLKGVIEFYICLADLSLESDMPDNPIMSPIWNAFMVSVLKGEVKVGNEVLRVYSKLLKTSFVNGLTLHEMYNAIYNILNTRYKNGFCNQCFR